MAALKAYALRSPLALALAQSARRRMAENWSAADFVRAARQQVRIASGVGNAGSAFSRIGDLDQTSPAFREQIAALERQHAEVLRAHRVDGKPLPAPNGQPSNLTAGQWLTVRTPNFKQWFGDWEAVGHRQFLDGEPVVNLTGEEFRPDGVPLTEKVPKWYAENGYSEVQVPGIGSVALDVRAVKDSFSHRKASRERPTAFAAVPAVLRNGRIVSASPLDGSRDGGVVFQIAAPVRMAGRAYVVDVVVKGDPKSRRMYVHEVIAKEKLQQIAGKTGADAAEAGVRTGAGVGAVCSVLHGIYEVNPDTLSKVVDANGEPLVVYHGTDGDVLAFDLERSRDADVWLTPVPGAAEMYSGARDGANLIPAYVALRNPYEAKIGDSRSDVLMRAIDRGHDGVIVREADGTVSTLAVFRPEQIKSATGNSSAFDPADPRIAYSRQTSPSAFAPKPDQAKRCREQLAKTMASLKTNVNPIVLGGNGSRPSGAGSKAVPDDDLAGCGAESDQRR